VSQPTITGIMSIERTASMVMCLEGCRILLLRACRAANRKYEAATAPRIRHIHAMYPGMTKAIKMSSSANTTAVITSFLIPIHGTTKIFMFFCWMFYFCFFRLIRWLLRQVSASGVRCLLSCSCGASQFLFPLKEIVHHIWNRRT